jgi:hypothetical protein
MILFGELNEGGMVEVGLSEDVVPKLQVLFKSKKIIENVNTKKVNEKTS